MGIGIIARDSIGRVHAATSQFFSTVQKPVVAEEIGALRAEFSQEWGLVFAVKNCSIWKVYHTKRRLFAGGKCVK